MYINNKQLKEILHSVFNLTLFEIRTMQKNWTKLTDLQISESEKAIIDFVLTKHKQNKKEVKK